MRRLEEALKELLKVSNRNASNFIDIILLVVFLVVEVEIAINYLDIVHYLLFT